MFAGLGDVLKTQRLWARDWVTKLRHLPICLSQDWDLHPETKKYLLSRQDRDLGQD